MGKKVGRDGFHVVTGAFGYSGRYIAQRLLNAGLRVKTLTNSPNRRNTFGGRVEAHPYNFNDTAALVSSLKGARVLYNTYWVRFNAPGFSHSEAVENTKHLFDAAREAGVRRIIHVSITNPSEGSMLEYFRGKAVLERVLDETGISHAILRPAVLFGKEDILINNIAWMPRRFPVFGVFGSGEYRLQPIYVDDLARLAVEKGLEMGNSVVDAIGPETYSYRGLVKTICAAIGKRRLIVPIPPNLGYIAGCLVGKMMGDVLLTRNEVKGLMSGLLCTSSRPAGNTRLSEWVQSNASGLGAKYSSELARRRERGKAYSEI